MGPSNINGLPGRMSLDDADYKTDIFSIFGGQIRGFLENTTMLLLSSDSHIWPTKTAGWYCAISLF